MSAIDSAPRTSCSTASMCGIGHVFFTVAALTDLYSTVWLYIAGGSFGMTSGADSHSVRSTVVMRPRESSYLTYLKRSCLFSWGYHRGFARMGRALWLKRSCRRRTWAGAPPCYMTRTELRCWRKSGCSCFKPWELNKLYCVSVRFKFNYSSHSSFVWIPMSHHSSVLSISCSKRSPPSAWKTPSITCACRPSLSTMKGSTRLSTSTLPANQSAAYERRSDVFNPRASRMGRSRRALLTCWLVTSHFTFYSLSEITRLICSTISTTASFMQTIFSLVPSGVATAM